MLILVGTGTKVVKLGRTETRYCDVCDREQPFDLFLTYKHNHVWFLCRWVEQKEYLRVCSACGETWRVKARKVEETLGKCPIPFYQRWGWLVSILAGLFAFALATVLVTVIEAYRAAGANSVPPPASAPWAPRGQAQAPRP